MLQRDGNRDLAFNGWLIGYSEKIATRVFQKENRGVEVSLFGTDKHNLVIQVRRWSETTEGRPVLMPAVSEQPVLETGTVKWFEDEKGFRFTTPASREQARRIAHRIVRLSPEQFKQTKDTWAWLSDKSDEASGKRRLLIIKGKRDKVQRRLEEETTPGLDWDEEEGRWRTPGPGSDTPAFEAAFEAFNRMAERIEESEQGSDSAAEDYFVHEMPAVSVRRSQCSIAVFDLDEISFRDEDGVWQERGVAQALEWLRKDGGGKLGATSKAAWIQACENWERLENEAVEHV